MKRNENQKQRAMDESTPAGELRSLAAESVALARLVAKNPSTPPDLLAQLAKHGDATVRRSVTKHPLTPWTNLRDLAVRFPREFLANTGLDQRLFDFPYRINHLSFKDVKRLAGKRGFSKLHPHLERHANWRVRELIVSRSRSKALLERMSGDASMAVRRGVAANRCTPASALEQLAGDTDYDVREAVAWNPNTPATALEQLAGDKHERVRRYVAENPNTPASALEQLLAGDKDYRVRRSVAKNPNTPAHLLEQLAGDKDYDVRGNVAGNPNTPAHLLEQLAEDEYEWVRTKVARNPNTPAHLLERLMREGAAENPNTPTHLLEQLAGDKSVYVRRNVAGNPNTPASTLEQLAKDKDKHVRVAAKPTLVSQIIPDRAHARRMIALARAESTNSKELSRLAERSIELARIVAKNPSASARLLKRLAAHEDPFVRNAVARHPGTPHQTLRNLASECTDAFLENPALDLMFIENPDLVNTFPFGLLKDLMSHPNFANAEMLEAISRNKHPDMRRAAASNPNASRAVLEKLSKDRILSVRLAVTTNAKAPRDLIDPMLERMATYKNKRVRRQVAENCRAPISALRALATDPDCLVRKKIASHPASPERLLLQLAIDEKISVRRAAAGNPKAPSSVLEKLARDKDERVSRVAQDQLTKRATSFSGRNDR